MRRGCGSAAEELSFLQFAVWEIYIYIYIYPGNWLLAIRSLGSLPASEKRRMLRREEEEAAGVILFGFVSPVFTAGSGRCGRGVIVLVNTI